MLPILEQLQQQLDELQQGNVGLVVPTIPAAPDPISLALVPVWEAIAELRKEIEADMKIKHAVVLDDNELNTLINPVIAACIATYASVEEQEAAVLSVKMDFEAALNAILHKAFKFGKKIGKARADDTDTEMYKD